MSDEPASTGPDMAGEADHGDYVRVNFTLPKSMRNDLKAAASSLGWTISRFIREAVNDFSQDLDKNIARARDEVAVDVERIKKDAKEFAKRVTGMGPAIRDVVREMVRELGIPRDRPADDDKAVNDGPSKYCLDCGERIPGVARYCPSCGARQPGVG